METNRVTYFISILCHVPSYDYDEFCLLWLYWIIIIIFIGLGKYFCRRNGSSANEEAPYLIYWEIKKAIDNKHVALLPLCALTCTVPLLQAGSAVQSSLWSSQHSQPRSSVRSKCVMPPILHYLMFRKHFFLLERRAKKLYYRKTSTWRVGWQTRTCKMNTTYVE